MPDLQGGKQATLRDVAELAGVSYQTVSRVVNAHPSVAEATRARVLQVIEQLDYRPNLAAQVLNTGRSNILQLINYGMTQGRLIPSLVRCILENGYTVAVTDLHDATSEDALREILSGTTQMAEGIVMNIPYPYLPYDVLVDLCRGRPFVFVRSELHAKMPSVVVDQRYGMLQVVNHLRALGHQQFAEVSGPLDHIEARMRHDFIVEALTAQDAELTFSVEGNFLVDGGYEGVLRLLQMGVSFTALVVANDEMALGALRALHEHGFHVPEDVSVVGFDDIREAAYYEPPLTTVRQDFDAVAKQSIEYLLAMINSPDTPVHQRVLYPELVVRNSTARAKYSL